MPAPFRWVITRPGSPSAEDFTEFSDWLQPDDQTADAVTLSSAPTPAEAGGAHISYDDQVLDPPVPADFDSVETTALANELTGAGDTLGAGYTHGGLSIAHTAWTMVEGHDPADDDSFQFPHVLNGSRGGSGATIAASAQDLFWKDAWRPAYPVGAVGYEVQLAEPTPGAWFPIAEPLSAELNLILASSTYNGTVTNAEAIAVLNTQWGEGPVEFVFAGPLLDLTVQRLAPMTLAAVEDDHYARATLFVPESGATDPPYVEPVTIADLSECPPYTGLMGLHATVKNYGGEVTVNDGNTLEVSANASVSGLYVIRPPRIRWIYATPEATPYRRIFPRDDALGAGSPRVWPPSKSYQSGRRIGGGYL